MNPTYENVPVVSTIWESVTIESVLKFAVAYFFIVWIAIIIWVIKDISNRTNSISLQVLSILIVTLFTPLWVFLYLLIRPGRTVFEKYYQEVEENLDILSRIIEQKTLYEQANMTTDCPECGYKIQPDYVICPNCETNLRHECINCKKEIRENWKVCPFCKAEQTKKTPKKSETNTLLADKKESKKEENTSKKPPLLKDKSTPKKDTQKEEKDAKETSSKKTD